MPELNDSQRQALLQDWRQQVQAASAAGTALCLRGSGSKSWYGGPEQGQVFDTRPLHGVISYEPSELVLSAYCGTPLAEVEALLAAQGQRLAFEPPHCGREATLGGMFAAGLSGPGRVAAGALREFVLGASLLNGRGEVLNFGGQVMKNVAGYDASRLLAGSLGVLGIVLQVSLKVLPLPPAEVSLRLEMREADALQNLLRWSGSGLPLTASLWQEQQLSIRLSGSEAALQLARRHIGGAVLAHAGQFWQQAREQELDFFRQDDCVYWRLALPPNVPPLSFAGEQLLEWHGMQRWLRVPQVKGADGALDKDWLQDTHTRLQQMARLAGGHACLYRAPYKCVPVFAPLPPALARIQRELKRVFDPAGIFNPGRMYADWGAADADHTG